MPLTPAHARCLNCNYPLHSLPTNTCPECGQQFNPANPATMNLGKSPGLLARKLLTHTGWPTLLLALAATITLFTISGPPKIVPPRVTDTLYILHRDWTYRSTSEKAYSGALILWLALLLLYLFRIISRLIAQRLYPNHLPQKSRANLRRLIFTFALFFSIAAVLYAWPARVAKLWIHSGRLLKQMGSIGRFGELPPNIFNPLNAPLSFPAKIN